MEQSINEMMINGVTYVRKGTENTQAASKDGLKYVIVRSYGAGVFAGYLKSKEDKGDKTDVTLLESKRIFFFGVARLL